MNRYEAYLDRGRLRVLDLDNGHIYHVKKHGRRIFSSVSDDETCPYDIYRDDRGFFCLVNLTTGETSTVMLTMEYPSEQQG